MSLLSAIDGKVVALFVFGVFVLGILWLTRDPHGNRGPIREHRLFEDPHLGIVYCEECGDWSDDRLDPDTWPSGPCPPEPGDYAYDRL